MSSAAVQSAFDYLGAAEVAIVAFFVVLAIVLLARYRQASERISASADLGHELWKALEDRLKKQDERILELMARVEVLQARLESVASLPRPSASPPASLPSQVSQPMQQPTTPKPAAEVKAPQQAQVELDATEKTALKFLEGGPRPTTDITEKLGRSREHTARLMKALYDRGLVERDESAKPFVYELTEAGRRYVS
jgi:DNA-binding transcriptional ArsR family regulator